MAALNLRPLSPVLGAELQAFERSDLQDGQWCAELLQALDRYQVLVIPAPDLHVEDHLALGRQFGALERHAFFPNLGPGYEEVSILDSQGQARADSWHSDESFLRIPAIATLTYAEILPPLGGDTCWVSMTAAYDALSEPMKRYLEDMTAVHDCARTLELGWQYAACDYASYLQMMERQLHSEQPVVIRHPRTGRKALFVNATYTRFLKGVSPAESQAVLNYLYGHIAQVHGMFRHRWREGDLLIWDNLFTQHYAVFDYPGQRRRMRRVSVLGTHPLEAA